MAMQDEIREAADLIEAIVVMIDDAPYYAKTEERLVAKQWVLGSEGQTDE